MVPGGTGMIRSSARLPWQLEVPPGSPAWAFQNLRLTISARLSVPATARRMTLPPSPPSPPSGPPLGTYFSRRKLTQPSPPLPAIPWMRARSISMSPPRRQDSHADSGGREHAQQPAGSHHLDLTESEVMVEGVLGATGQIAH